MLPRSSWTDDHVMMKYLSTYTISNDASLCLSAMNLTDWLAVSHWPSQ